ncbi:MAG: hypothetical protein JO139_18120 [Alphaproteobacteria bacterium]|nr:hypothetical protein [Alphaproteobacteria bacterium]
MDLTELERSQQISGSADRQVEGRPLAGVSGAAPARNSAEQHRLATAERIETLAKAADHAAGDLDASFPQTSRFLHDTAAGFEHISNFLHDPKLDDITGLAGNVRRMQPAAIVAGLVLVGMGLSWVFRRSEAAPM